MGAHLVLASASPRRHDLLNEWGLTHTIRIPRMAEDLDQGAEIGPLALGLATGKAEVIRLRLGEEERRSSWVLGADTIVALGSRALGKPEDEKDAMRMLLELRGRWVEVISAVCVLSPDERSYGGWQTTSLKMKPWTDDEVRAYVATGEPMGKAGAFAIQGLGGQFIARREGSWSNVVGLPRQCVMSLLRQSGYPLDL